METNPVGRGPVPRHPFRRPTGGRPTEESGLEAVELRLEKLEKANRRLIPLLAGLGAMLVLILALAATKPAPATLDVIRAKKLEIVDDAGKTRISLSIEPPGTARLMLFDDKGNKRGGFTQLADQSSLDLLDEKGHPRASLWVDASGPVLALFNEKGNWRARLVQATLRLFDKDGKVIWQAPPK